jgi:hypothetical protein
MFIGTIASLFIGDCNTNGHSHDNRHGGTCILGKIKVTKDDEIF